MLCTHDRIWLTADYVRLGVALSCQSNGLYHTTTFAAIEIRTRDLSITSPTLYHTATSAPVDLQFVNVNVNLHNINDVCSMFMCGCVGLLYVCVTSETTYSTFSTPFYPNKQTTVTALDPDLIILNLPTIMTIETLLIECSFAIPVALPNTLY